MRACYAQCAHRRFVLDYYAERDAQLRRAETATGLNATELAAYFGDDGEGDAVEKRWTFRRHLEAYSGPHYPYPRPGRPAPIPFLEDVDDLSRAV